MAACLAVLPTVVLAQAPAKAPKQTTSSASNVEPTAISGLATSGRHCIGPEGANVHSLGWVTANSRITVTFSSDFDPVASVTNMQLGTAAPDRLGRSSFWADDDGGGNLEPYLNFTTSYAGTLNLHVARYSPDRNAGCYYYKVEIQTA